IRYADLVRELHAVRVELGAGLRHVGRAEGDVVRIRREWKPESVEVVAPRPRQVLGTDGVEVDLLDFHYPTEPSICSWIRRFISTAYSSGSSFVIGSTKPDTTIADASDSDRPRDIR